ncbi:MAG: Ku protein [Parachlamydiaceae bacterium]|nr:Ku protein [Parachlamydiaceae bacterium]
MRALWTGALSFGLINIPIRLFSATEDHGLSFNMLHKKDLSPIRFARICKVDGKEIPYEDIVKGYEYEKGDFVVLTDEDFKRADVRKTKLIDIVDFTYASEIDPILFEKPYYLEPGKGASKAYVILREALKKSKKVAIAKYVLHNREHIGVVMPHDNLLILDQLRYESEIRSPKSLDIPKEAMTTSKEVTMALKLIEHLTTHFKPKQYHDTYTEELQKIIDEKAHGKKPHKKGKEPKITDLQDIMGMLKKSLEKHHKKTA